PFNNPSNCTVENLHFSFRYSKFGGRFLPEITEFSKLILLWLIWSLSSVRFVTLGQFWIAEWTVSGVIMSKVRSFNFFPPEERMIFAGVLWYLDELAMYNLVRLNLILHHKSSSLSSTTVNPRQFTKDRFSRLVQCVRESSDAVVMMTFSNLTVFKVGAW
ncbi:14964_t:CDS:2, partial [Acaulospora colombiana]